MTQSFSGQRHKCWRLLQSTAGVENVEYKAQRSLLEKVDSGDISIDELQARAGELFEQELAELSGRAAAVRA